MKKTTLKSLEKRIAELESRFEQLLQVQPTPRKFKDWRKAAGTVTRTELAEEIDAAAREIREADRRKARK